MRGRPNRPGSGPRRRARPGTPATPSASRPAARRSGAGGAPGTTTRTSAPRPRRRFTGRAVVLTVVLAALALSYVFPLRVYLGQQAEIAELRAAQAEKRAHVEELAAEAALWSDDDYVRVQARKRLYFGEPDETLLLPVWEDEQAPPETGFDPDDAPAPPDVWWDTLWVSIRSANGSAPEEAAPDEAVPGETVPDEAAPDEAADERG